MGGPDGEEATSASSTTKRRRLERGASGVGGDCDWSADLAKFSCAYCLRDGNSDNPCPKRHAGPKLNFISKGECKPCRNYCNGVLSGVSKSLIRKQTQDPKKLAEYLASLSEHEKLFDNTDGQLRNARDLVQLPSWVVQKDEQGA